LKQFLQNEAKRNLLTLTDRRGRPWAGSQFKHAWKRTMVKAGIVGLTFGDLRGTFVSRAAVRGASEPEIAYITGDGLGDIRRILDHHYLHRDPALGAFAIRKLQRKD
jgi:integrase